MPESDSEILDRIANAIADGDSIDWEELERLPLGSEVRQRLQDLRLLADIAELNRSAFDDVPDSKTREPLPGPLVEPIGEGVEEADGAFIGRWGHLLLRRKIGEGSFGEVFHAHDSWLDHPVALKLLKPEIEKGSSAGRILREARKLARVRHPNVVVVHGADRHDGRIGFWMDLVEGQTLAAIVGNGRLSAGEASHIGQEVCRALTAVHHAKLVHRDVKAQNVMRASDGGRIILMDFGAGEFIDAPATAGVEGTPLYLAPESFRGATPTEQSDIYAVGVLLYYLVTNTFPVKGPSFEALATAHQSGRRRPLRDRRPDLPDSFVAIVERALEPEPARRFASAGKMLDALAGEAPTDRTVPVVTAPLPATASSVGPITRGVLALVGAIALVEVVGFVACRIFDVALQVDSDFSAGPLTFLRVGTEAMFPLIVTWIAITILLAVIWATGRLFRRRLDALSARWPVRVDPVTLAISVFIFAILGFAAVTWTFWSVFVAIGELVTAPSPFSVDASILSPAAMKFHESHGASSALLSFVLSYAVFRWFPAWERATHEPSIVRLLKWATVAVVLMTIVSVTMSRRLAWETFPEVVFENRPAHVIAQRGEELFLVTSGPDGANHRVREGTPGLRRLGRKSEVFPP